jgi:hypothetical protein
MKSLSLALLSVGIAAALVYANNPEPIAYVWIFGLAAILFSSE